MMIGHLLGGLAAVLEYLFTLIQYIIIASVAVSLIGAPTSNPIVGMINAISEPLYRPFRGIARKIPGPLDWAPMLLIFMIIFLSRSLLPWLYQLSHSYQ
jgi:uncharacterized protein YggT (Ycf19 family)